MADGKLMMKKWAAALQEFAQKTNRDFMKDPQGTIRRLQPKNAIAFEKVYKQYLKDCGLEDFLGECRVEQYEIYTEGLFSGRKVLAISTEIEYGHWNHMPPDLIKSSWLFTSPDLKSAIGMVVKLTDGKGGYRKLILGQKEGDTWSISQQEWDGIMKKMWMYSEAEVIYYMFLQFLMPDVCPKNINKLKNGRLC